MSLLSFAFPFGALPAAEAFAGTAVNVARPLLGLGVLAALVVVFKPLLVGVMRAALLLVRPRNSLEERNMRRRIEGVLLLNRMARELEDSQPGQAAELRWLASR